MRSCNQATPHARVCDGNRSVLSPASQSLAKLKTTVSPLLNAIHSCGCEWSKLADQLPEWTWHRLSMFQAIGGDLDCQGPGCIHSLFARCPVRHHAWQRLYVGPPPPIVLAANQDLNPVHDDLLHAIIIQREQAKPLLHRRAGVRPLLRTVGQAQHHRHPLNIPRKFRTGPRTCNPSAGQHLIGPIRNRTRNLLQGCPGSQQRPPFAVHDHPRPQPVQMFPFAPRKAPLRNARRVGIGGIRPPGDVQRIADKFISGHGI